MMKKLALILLLVAVVVAIPVGVVLVKQRQGLSSSAAPTTTLSLSPASASKDVNDSFSVAVKINTGGNTVVTSDIVLNYNSQVLEATGITSGTFFESGNEIQKSINNTAGKIIYSVYVANTAAKTGEGTLITVAFKAKAAGTSPVTFDAQSAVGAIGEGNVNVLVSTVPGSYTVGGGAGATASPSPAPSGSGQPTASPTVTPLPGGVQLSPTPTGSATPAPTQASSGTVTLTSIQNGASINTLRPTFSGKAPANSQVTITVRSDPITGTVTADASGNWTWTPPSSLALGSHSATIVATNSSGQQTQATVNFTVAGTVPASGVGEYTIILIILGFAGLAGAFLLSL